MVGRMTVYPMSDTTINSTTGEGYRGVPLVAGASRTLLRAPFHRVVRFPEPLADLHHHQVQGHGPDLRVGQQQPGHLLVPLLRTTASIADSSYTNARHLSLLIGGNEGCETRSGVSIINDCRRVARPHEPVRPARATP
jgi:hypothetical protein